MRKHIMQGGNMPSLEDTIQSCWKGCPYKGFNQSTQNEVTIEEVEQFYNFLQGEVPPQFYMKRPPHLSETMAFRIIYYLQEIMHVIPDKFERCVTCGCIYDSENEGNSRKGCHCDYCA